MVNFEMKEDDENEDEIIEKRRQQRLVILQKYKSQEPCDSPAVSAVSSPSGSESNTRIPSSKTIPKTLVSNDDNNDKNQNISKSENIFGVDKPNSKPEEKVYELSDMFADDYKVRISSWKSLYFT